MRGKPYRGGRVRHKRGRESERREEKERERERGRVSVLRVERAEWLASTQTRTPTKHATHTLTGKTHNPDTNTPHNTHSTRVRAEQTDLILTMKASVYDQAGL